MSLIDKEEIRRNVLNSSLSDVITKLHLEIPPTKSFGYYYSYNGISEILSNMLKVESNSDKQDLRNGDVSKGLLSEFFHIHFTCIVY